MFSTTSIAAALYLHRQKFVRKEERKGGLSEVDTPSDYSKDPQFEQLREQFLSLSEKYRVSPSTLFSSLQKQELKIPLSIFGEESGLEIIVFYLRTKVLLKNKDIAMLLNRSEKTISQAFIDCQKKFSGTLHVTSSSYDIPLHILAHRELSILESIVSYMKEQFSLTFHDIAILLKRNDRTIWTVYKRAQKKQKKESN